MSVGWARGAEVAPGNTEKLFSLQEGAEVTKEEPRKLPGTETPSLSIPPSQGRCCSQCPT